MNPNIIKAYDIRGIYPSELNEEAAYELGAGFAGFVRGQKVVVGYDARLSSQSLFKSFVRGVRDAGGDAINIGLVSSDMLYFASGLLSLPAVMITASHNPAAYNGFKFCLARAEPLAPKEINFALPKRKTKKGRVIKKNLFKEYRRHVLKFIDPKKLKPLKIGIDAGNGVAGKIILSLFKNLPFKIIPLYFKPDGFFPHHVPNPLHPENTKDLERLVIKYKANAGLAFDGDADRVFFIDEAGKRIAPSFTIALLSKNILASLKNENVVYSLVCSHIVKETIEQNGGKAIPERVGHTFIKKKMQEANAVFGAEHSGHYYFRENYYTDSGFIAALKVLEILSDTDQSFSEIIKPFQKYFAIEETNIAAEDDEDKERILECAKQKYSNGRASELDGLTVEYNDWWFNLRPSNTEPVIRLNLEAKNQKLADEKKEEILKLVTNY